MNTVAVSHKFIKCNYVTILISDFKAMMLRRLSVVPKKKARELLS